MKLSELRPPKGARRRRRRLGRGAASGSGKTSGRGNKGAGQRTGYRTRPGFEGGQMPLQRRLPKRGFRHAGKKLWLELNVGALARFTGATAIDPEYLKAQGLLKQWHTGVKLLANGDVAGKYALKVNRASASAVKKIETAGGTVEIV